MRLCRTLILTCLFLGLGAAVSSSQSLADVAKKEKERRVGNDAQPRTITDRDLAAFSGDPSPAQTPLPGEAAQQAPPEAEDERVQDDTKTKEYWQNRVKAAKERVAKAEARLQSDDWGDGLRVGVNPQGVINLTTREREEKEVADARAALDALFAEARRAGVPPGWVR